MTARPAPQLQESFAWLFGITAEPLLLVESAASLAASTVVAANSVAADIHHMPAEDMVGIPYGDLLGPSNDDSGVQDGIDGAVVWHQGRAGNSFPVARRVSIVPGRTDLQLVALSPLGIPGQPRASFLHAQRLETLGMVAGQVAHDLNNVLVGILTEAALLVDELADDDPLRERINGIAIAGRDARALTRQLVGTATSSVERQELDLNAMIDEVLLLFSAVAGPDATTSFDAGSELRTVSGSAVQLRQAVLNLLLNANAALGERGGDITIRTYGVSGSDVPSQSLVVREPPVPSMNYQAIEVSDSGEGMPPDVLVRAFEPFFTTRVDGTGLGLPAVVAAIAAHDGLIGAASEPGEGSRFTIYLPAAA